MATAPKRPVIKDEVQNDDITFTFDGKEYTVENPQKWDLDILEAQESGRVVGAVKLLLGEAQYETFRSKRRVLKDLEELMDAIYEAMGSDPKE